ncbi:hypothetical protein ACTU45_35045, partial [Streptomyces sp. 24-1644]|uniref:hypothetical protein n=1 Tax=Streptomyces sp. 24-1644 TaxID=3457315 RepID=UPI003FA6BC99
GEVTQLTEVRKLAYRINFGLLDHDRTKNAITIVHFMNTEAQVPSSWVRATRRVPPMHYLAEGLRLSTHGLDYTIPAIPR